MRTRGLFGPGSGPDNRNPANGFKTMLEGGLSSIPGDLVNRTGDNREQQGNNYRFGGLLTYEKPITEFTGDIVVPSLTDATYQNGGVLPNNCVGFRLISVIPAVQISINNSPLMTVISGDAFNNMEVKNLRIITDAAGSCTLQAWGTGD